MAISDPTAYVGSVELIQMERYKHTHRDRRPQLSCKLKRDLTSKVAQNHLCEEDLFR